MKLEKRGKVGVGGREIMAALWGSKGRPETNEYADLCAEQARRQNISRSLKVTEIIKPKP